MTDARLLRALLRLILAAAVLTAPLFLFAEGFKAEYAWRVALSNGVCTVLCLALLRLASRGRERLAAQLLVWGLMLLVGTLASSNGEPVHVNVINFTLVVVLASALIDRRGVASVAAISAAVMSWIAWRQPLAREGQDLAEARFESLAQILPTFVVVSLVLWLRAGPREPAE